MPINEPLRHLLEVAPSKVYHSNLSPDLAGSSYLPPFHPYLHAGGIVSVALFRGSPQVDVIHYFALRSPEVPRHTKVSTFQ